MSPSRSDKHILISLLLHTSYVVDHSGCHKQHAVSFVMKLAASRASMHRPIHSIRSNPKDWKLVDLVLHKQLQAQGSKLHSRKVDRVMWNQTSKFLFQIEGLKPNAHETRNKCEQGQATRLQ